VLHFFKSKPYLSDLIPDNHVDIHSHLLPGIDDGAKNIDDTLSLINQMQKIGFKNIITTPHIITNVWDNTKASIEAKFNETIFEITDKTNINSFKFGAEYMMDSNFINKIENDKLLTIKENYLLIEMSYLSPPIQLYDIFFELQIEGYKPILAHPERYLFYHNKFSDYEKLKKSGCLFQLNLLSVVGYYGENVAEISSKLLEKGMIDFVGSDIHHQNHINSFFKKIKIKNQIALEKAISNNILFIE
jgi:protein-tyrosine phosphatase